MHCTPTSPRMTSNEHCAFLRIRLGGSAAANSIVDSKPASTSRSIIPFRIARERRHDRAEGTDCAELSVGPRDRNATLLRAAIVAIHARCAPTSLRCETRTARSTGMLSAHAVIAEVGAQFVAPSRSCARADAVGDAGRDDGRSPAGP